MPQYVEVRFRPGDRRTYTYHNEGESVAAGDHVEVDARGSVKTVEVVSVSGFRPPYATKPIVKRIPKEPSDDRKSALMAGDAPLTVDEQDWLAKANEAEPNDPLDGVGDG